MALFTRGSVERVKEAVDMVELVGARTDLRRVGTRHVGLCPFHDERTPSFSVNAEHALYHCFGCGESGDSIKFVRETEGLEFAEAVEHLAERYGVELEREEEGPRAEESRRRRDRLMRLLDRTATFYARFLWDAGEARAARAHLAERGLSEETLRTFRVGYAPSAWNRVLAAGQRDGYAPGEMVAAGVAQPGRDGGYFDRFRARITFPLSDARGRVLGFGARAVRDSQKPKYLNSSENELYRKGRHLFGIDHARAPAAKAGRVVVVEGYTDVLALHGAGIRESVAIMGTALTGEQLTELGRAATTVLMALDADASGQEAMLRAARAATERGMELRVVALPAGSDPAELVVAQGAAAFERLLSAAVSVPEFETARVLDTADLATTHGRDRALERVRPLVAATPERSIVRDELVRRVTDRLEVPSSYVTGSGGGGRAATAPARPSARERPTPKAPSAEGAARVAATPPRPSAPAPAERAERAFLAMCLGQPTPGRELLWRAGEGYLSPRFLPVREHLLAHPDDPLAELPTDDEQAALVTEVAMLAEVEPSTELDVRLSFVQLELRRAERELRAAARERDYERQRALWAERERLREQFDELMGALG
ncbi:MAG: DNA primase [uncultured Solirubrobacterales bacterium]|uniref:DNA primase n=1 Tax=uncultured Solirubrobacterales bacterium TaxID=768556 RepID=A0A6J4T7K1_9ACTN|nr:MAG: DNA primase [uncultured Solirubrobacterales bacterium]